ncbi:MAG: carboxypeptidase regulatory-like domain-containing protein, partial [Edaphobacter sp.]
GTVISSVDGAPVPHSHLTATAVARSNAAGRQFPAPINTFDADDHGHFSISIPSAGMWNLSVSARGYVTQSYEEHESFSSGIVLTNSMPVIDLRFRLSPEGVITGNVLDEAGEPVRNANVSLLQVRPPGPDSTQPPALTRARISTDDRGSYEFDDLQPGDYRINVQAQVWYAMAAQQNGSTASDQHPLDPSLDVTYPLTWYPGTDNPSEAEILTLRAGDSRQADFHLLPVPSVHLRILPDAGVSATGRRIQSYPMIERISSGGTGFVPVSAHIDPQGMMEVGGLAPGRYEVKMQGAGRAINSALVDITAGSIQTLDMSAAPTMAEIAIHTDGIPEAEANSIQVSLIDPETGRNVARDAGSTYVLTGTLLRRRKSGTAGRILEVPPGRYQVVLNGNPNLDLTGITAQSADASGRYVTVASGNSVLTLHIAEGRATLTGIVTVQDKPSVGAMVLLVPATLGDQAGVNIIRRDQTNTDGSFDLDNVLPGQYILIAIDQGWQINWKDPSTLRGYMMHGVPVELTAAANIKETIEAQVP